MLRQWIPTVIFIFNLILLPSDATCFDSLLLFGDSYFDTHAGNDIANSLEIPPPNASPPYFEGRHCDGPIWIDFVSHLLQLPYDNYAVSGSTTGSDNIVNALLGGLIEQLDRFKADADLSSPPIKPSTLVIIDGGGNDLIRLLHTPSSLNFAGIAEVIHNAIDNLTYIFEELQTLGAEKIIMWNLGNMGMLPWFVDPALGITSLSPLYTKATYAYNEALCSLIEQFNGKAAQNQHIYYFDTFSFIDEVKSVLTAQGVDVSHHAITTYPNDIYFPSHILEEPLAFYDQLHPSSLAWRLFADKVVAFINEIDPEAGLVECELQENAMPDQNAAEEFCNSEGDDSCSQAYSDKYAEVTPNIKGNASYERESTVYRDVKSFAF